MSNFTLEKFNPTLNELKELAEKHNWLDINWIEDKEWYEKLEKYNQWKDENWYNEKDFMIQREWDIMVMYKRISTFSI